MRNGTRHSTRAVRNNSSLVNPVSQRWREGLFILSVALSLLLLAALVTYHAGGSAGNASGRAGAAFAYGLFYLFGYISYLLPFAISYGVWMFTRARDEDEPFPYDILIWRGLGFFLALISSCGLAALQMPYMADAPIAQMPYSGGGILGTAVSLGLAAALNYSGATVLLFSLFLCGLTLFTGLSWAGLIEVTGELAYGGIARISAWLDDRREAREADHAAEESAEKARARMRNKSEPVIVENEPATRRGRSRKIEPEILDEALEEEQEEQIEEITEEEGEGEEEEAQDKISKMSSRKNLLYKNNVITVKTQVKTALKSGLPSLGLLDPPEPSTGRNYTPQSLEAMSRNVELRLKDFGIIVQVVAAHPGPVVTRFEMQLAPGIKVSRITTLAKDLARSLSVVSVRVVEVIPGKSVVGLELPNQHREIVRLSEVLSSQQYAQARSPLSLALGKDISGHPVVVDLGKMPHLLVAGTTGAGKSVGLNAMLLSFLFKSSPRDIRMIMIDPKMLELSIYEGIPHLLTPVVTDMKEAANALRWCVGEMERRYRLMANLGVRNLAGYNIKVNEAREQGEPLLDPLWRPNTPGAEDGPPALEALPYIVVIIDEFADMIMVVGKKVEELIARIAQKARAAGIHLILATQRPSVDVITGLIKANIPTRIAFQVSSKIDSRTILDQQGAEQLLGHGDMLYLAPGTGVPIRVHGAYVADDEVHKVVEDWKQRGEPDYIDGLCEGEGSIGSAGDNGLGSEDAEADELYDQAVQIVVETRRASISGVQRRLKIGYNRAARLLEAMENAGIVSPMESNGTREVLVPEDVN